MKQYCNGNVQQWTKEEDTQKPQREGAEIMLEVQKLHGYGSTYKSQPFCHHPVVQLCCSRLGSIQRNTIKLYTGALLHIITDHN